MKDLWELVKSLFAASSHFLVGAAFLGFWFGLDFTVTEDNYAILLGESAMWFFSAKKLWTDLLKPDWNRVHAQ